MKTYIIYVGKREEGEAKVYRGTISAEGEAEGPLSLLPMRSDVKNHSPTGFEWGYNGSGPAQLALAILIDLIGVGKAIAYYQDFKASFIAKLERDKDWRIMGDEVFGILRQIEGWVE